MSKKWKVVSNACDRSKQIAVGLQICHSRVVIGGVDYQRVARVLLVIVFHFTFFYPLKPSFLPPKIYAFNL
ncbi:hypothetical protein HMPREF9151_01404 [Hoylesella saccharolytica F0055]|uniref:Uncharacterized protein n=1 Tax=Hoylesella saccharolytica F0055 TaxID=1127699 RepID=L1N918_9BACT|nr:hypothetical protein HMPREF9151_01404 [Hoylesella saccharolytica F0055]